MENKTVSELRSELMAIVNTKGEYENIYITLPKQWRKLMWQMPYEYFPAGPHEKHHEGYYQQFGCFIKFANRDNINIERIDYSHLRIEDNE